VGRFINKDTYEGDISNPLTLNLYTYVGNNPLRFIDPSGHDPREVQLMLEMARDGELGMSDVKDRLGSYYQRIFQDDDNNYFNYLFGMATMTSAYENSLGNSQWAIGVLVEVNTADLVSAHELANLLESMIDFNAALVKGAKSARVRASSNLSAECNCFTAGTKVLTDEGEKNIEDIEVGDKVLSKDEATGEVAYKEVTATFNHETDEIYNIQVGGQTIESTFNHPFYVEGKGWTFVKDLKVGDLLVQSDGNTLKIDGIELEHKHVTVYNMTVDEFHTYFVSDLGIWVHNTGSCAFGNFNLGDLSKMKKGDILGKLPEGWKYTENNGFVHVKDANGNIRMRIDPPDKVTKYDHAHLYNEKGESLDINGNVVNYKDPSAHIEILK
jgi:hypothetical protein